MSTFEEDDDLPPVEELKRTCDNCEKYFEIKYQSHEKPRCCPFCADEVEV